MKKLIFVVTVLFIAVYGFAQVPTKRNSKSTSKLNYESPPVKGINKTVEIKPGLKQAVIDGRLISFIPMGQSGNAYGLARNSRTYLWAEPNINSVVFTHRMTGGVEVNGNGRIAYDVSVDGGETWETNVQVFDDDGPGYSDYPARYPQGCIINPVGNFEPENAYYTYYAPVTNYWNGVWGASTYGSNPLTLTDPPNPTQIQLTTEDGYYRYIPDALTTTTEGIAWFCEPSIDYNTLNEQYTGQLILSRGEIIDGEIIYEEQLYDFLEPLDTFNDSKIAFAPDGQTGYMCFMSDVQSSPLPYTNFHPVLLKTVDGGETWSDPIHVQLGGLDGIAAVKNYWSDETLDTIYGTSFNRNEVYYNMGYSVDIIVDNQNSPHIVGVIAIADEDIWYPQEGTMATWHLFSDDGGSNWQANALYDNIFLEGDIGGLTQYNRPYAMSTYDGEWLFFSWIDTDLVDAEGNTNPNIFMIACYPQFQWYNYVDNITELSLYWFSAYYSTASQYVFTYNWGGGNLTAEIPMVITEYTIPGDPGSEMNFHYLKGYTIDLIIEGLHNQDDNPYLSVKQNSPNPASKTTNITVSTKEPGRLVLTIKNIQGTTVYEETCNNNALIHNFKIDVSEYKPGIYLYTVESGLNRITKKMLVKN